jgi:hypothetical protein
MRAIALFLILYVAHPAALTARTPDSLRAGVGQKTRFPTMRELFDEALDRFMVNPELEPESALMVEVGLGLGIFVADAGRTVLSSRRAAGELWSHLRCHVCPNGPIHSTPMTI